MNRTWVISTHRRKKHKENGINKSNLLLVSIMECFFIIGIFSVKMYPDSVFSVWLENTTAIFTTEAVSKPIFSNLLISLSISLSFHIVAFLFGLSAAGILFSVFVVSLYGFLWGGMLSKIMSISSNGILCAIVLLIPYFSVTSVTLINEIKSAAMMSVDILKYLIKSDTGSTKYTLKEYLMKFCILTVPYAAASAIYSVCVIIFGKLIV